MADNIKDDILTIDQAAQLLQVSSRTVYDLVSDERIPGKIFAKKVGRSWRIMRREIDSFLSEEKSGFHQMSLSQKEAKIKSE
jgi:excisionase family DNA binding protein